MESRVEPLALARSGQRLAYAPEEKIGVIVAGSFPLLGRLAALRFLEWVQDDPEGVVALPSGKTPEYFIKEVQRFLHGWQNAEIRRDLEQGGVDAGKGIELRGLRFVQIDEFYPMDSTQHNSFYYYVTKYYLRGFGLDPARALLIDSSRIGLPPGRSLADVWTTGEVDLSLRYRSPSSPLEALQKGVIERIDQWCAEREESIRALGGIGFFLGGIGPDGHIGFNVRGSDLFSTTRLCSVNYETQAAAAADLGGIEVARKRLVITIGLATITYNPECVAVIMAAGEAKAKIVAESITSPADIHYPASCLSKLTRSRFYLTSGAAKLLARRQVELLAGCEQLSEEQVERIVVDLSLSLSKRIDRLSEEDFRADPAAALLLKRSLGSAQALTLGSVQALTREVSERLKAKIEAGVQIRKDKIFLHTEPHHDDLMLGCLPFIVRHIREHSTRHYFATMTSGFNAVTNRCMRAQLEKLRSCLSRVEFKELLQSGYFEPGNHVRRNRDVWQYLDGVAAGSSPMRDDGEMRRLARNLISLYNEPDVPRLEQRIAELIRYFETRYPGQKDVEVVQRLKGMCREWEADCLWGYFGWSSRYVRPLRLGFYAGEVFSEDPTMNRDVAPILKLLQEVRPDIVTLVIDPEASGPDTHYKVLQAITSALRLYQDSSKGSGLEAVGYRNVWHRFHPSEANLFVPVSLNMFALQESAFMNTFISQKEASFPSYDHDGPFCELAQKIQVEQYQMLKTCLGREYFYEHPSALIRATRGLVFLKSMNLQELLQLSRELRLSTENR